MDVLERLIEDHREAEAMIEALVASDPGAERKQTLAQLEKALATHMAVEERFVYPIVRQTIGSHDAEGADHEHTLVREGLASMRELVDQPGFGAAVEMLKAGIAHHVEEEENDMFPKLREEASEELTGLGTPEELEAAVANDPASDAEAPSGGGKDLDDMSREELYERAQSSDIEGRSSMSKDELRSALAES